MKKMYFIFGVVIILIIAIVLAFLKIGIGENSGEDNWIQDSNGAWIPHGNPLNIPDYIVDSKTLECTFNLYQSASTMKMQFNSQCLGTCGNYSIDIVHIPRNSDDNLPENQCEDYKNSLTNHFIEMNKDGEIIKIV